jgi:hypothetical protein
MINMLNRLGGTKVLIYIDDIIQVAALEVHNERLLQVLEQFVVHSLCLQPDKCYFLKEKVCY